MLGQLLRWDNLMLVDVALAAIMNGFSTIILQATVHLLGLEPKNTLGILTVIDIANYRYLLCLESRNGASWYETE